MSRQRYRLARYRAVAAVVAVAGLPMGALVEIEAWAYGVDDAVS